jgi:hypothetical protein
MASGYRFPAINNAERRFADARPPFDNRQYHNERSSSYTRQPPYERRNFEREPPFNERRPPGVEFNSTNPRPYYRD